MCTVDFEILCLLFGLQALELKFFPGRGFGVVVNMRIAKDQVIGEYSGVFHPFEADEFIPKEDMITLLNSDYIVETSKGLIDASGVICDRNNGCISFCRFLNHACTEPESNTKMVVSRDRMRVFFKTKRVIKKGEELCISYVLSASDKKKWFGTDGSGKHLCVCCGCVKKLIKSF